MYLPKKPVAPVTAMRIGPSLSSVGLPLTLSTEAYISRAAGTAKVRMLVAGREANGRSGSLSGGSLGSDLGGVDPPDRPG